MDAFRTISDADAFKRRLPQRERFHRLYAKSAFGAAPVLGGPRMTRERDFYEFLESVDGVVRRIRNLSKGGSRQGVPGDLVEQFFRLAISMDAFLAASFDHHRIQPDIGVVLEIFRSQASVLRCLASEGGGSDECTRHALQCIAACRNQFASEDCTVARKRFSQQQQQSIRSCGKYFAGLLCKHSRLFISRVDLYSPVCAGWWQLRDFLMAEAALDQLLRRLREGRVVESLLGYAVVRESGPCRGMHYSVLAAQGGHEPRDGDRVASAIGAEWVGLFTDSDERPLSKANYFNCYAHPESSPWNKIGLVEQGDQRSERALEGAIHGMFTTPIVFDAGLVRDNAIKNPAGSLDGIHFRNLRKGKM